MYFTRRCTNLTEEDFPDRHLPPTHPRGAVDRTTHPEIWQLDRWFDIYYPGVPRREAERRLPDLARGGLGTCAVVGNADNLLAATHGAEIDRHDFVFRFNTPLKGYEAHVGRRTSGLWTKPGYSAGGKRGGDVGAQKPSRFHVSPKERSVTSPDGVPVLVYGPSLPRWRQAAGAIYAAYKSEHNIDKGKPTGGWARVMAVVDSDLCTRVDIYGYSAGGGKYFARSSLVKDAHVVRVEHFSHRLIMATGIKGKVCVYGD